MKNEKIETPAQESKAVEVKEYVKPTVTKHTAASLLVGSSGCGMYVSQTSGGAYYY